MARRRRSLDGMALEEVALLYEPLNFILSAVINHHLQAQVKNCTQEDLQLLILLRESFYVDDCV